MKARSSIVVLALLSLACAASVTAQTNITIQNPSFETFNALNQPPGTWNEGPIPSWSSASAVGVNLYGSWQPAAGTFQSLPDGATVAFTNGATLTQDLGIIPNAGDSYIMSVFIGHRPDGYVTTYNVGLNVGAQSICNSSGSNGAWAAGTFQQVSVTCTIPSGTTGNLIISLGSIGAQIDFDKVSLVLNTKHSVTLNWTASTTPGVSYNVYRSAGAAWNPILLANVTTTSYVDTTIVFGSNYVYKVTAVLSGVESDFPSPVTVVTQ